MLRFSGTQSRYTKWLFYSPRAITIVVLSRAKDPQNELIFPSLSNL